MPRLTSKPPKYCKHKASGQAVVTFNSRDFYLGPYGSKASRIEYDRLIGEWMQNGRRLPSDGESELTVTELAAAYWRHAKSYYSKDGKPTGELGWVKDAMRPLKQLYGHTEAASFGPLALKALRQHFINSNLSRGVVNGRVSRIKRMFRWAVSEELVPANVLHGLQSVTGLRRGRSDARETPPVLPVEDGAVEAVLPHLPAVIADMVRFQRLTGCRPSEVCMLRPCDVDTSGEVWFYRPESHKTEHHGCERIVVIGPKAQDVLRPYLLREKSACCFVPAESEKKRNVDRRENRRTPMTPSQAKRRPKRNRKRALGDQYDANSYRRAIHRACDRAGIERWSPNRLRHAAATEIRKRFGLEAAQVTLGHSRADVTQIYAERDLDLAARVRQEVG